MQETQPLPHSLPSPIRWQRWRRLMFLCSLFALLTGCSARPAWVERVGQQASARGMLRELPSDVARHLLYALNTHDEATLLALCDPFMPHREQIIGDLLTRWPRIVSNKPGAILEIGPYRTYSYYQAMPHGAIESIPLAVRYPGGIAEVVVRLQHKAEGWMVVGFIS